MFVSPTTPLHPVFFFFSLYIVSRLLLFPPILLNIIYLFSPQVFHLPLLLILDLFSFLWFLPEFKLFILIHTFLQIISSMIFSTSVIFFFSERLYEKMKRFFFFPHLKIQWTQFIFFIVFFIVDFILIREMIK